MKFCPWSSFLPLNWSAWLWNRRNLGMIPCKLAVLPFMAFHTWTSLAGNFFDWYFMYVVTDSWLNLPPDTDMFFPSHCFPFLTLTADFHWEVRPRRRRKYTMFSLTSSWHSPRGGSSFLTLLLSGTNLLWILRGVTSEETLPRGFMQSLLTLK